MQKKENTVLLVISAGMFLFLWLMSLNPHYEYFIDEFYYLACAKHLGFGYVDHPPFAPVILAGWTAVFGESLLSIRLLPAISAAAAAFFAGIIARRLGGGMFAQSGAALTVCFTPLIASICSFYSMNCFEIIVWTSLLYLLLVIIDENRPRLWLLFGLVAGLGIMNKHTTGLLGLGLFIALILTKDRRQFMNKYLWLGLLLCMLIVLPNIIWQVQNDFPSIEFYRNSFRLKDMHMPPQQFLATLAFILNPITLPVWILGFYYLIRPFNGKKTRTAGLTAMFVLVFVLISGTNRIDRVAGLFPFLFAGGMVFVEHLLSKFRFGILKPVFISLLVIAGLAIHLVALPVLPPEALEKYTAALHIPERLERGKKARILQIIGDRIGWEKLARKVSEAYIALPDSEKPYSLAFGSYYGIAGSLGHYAKQYPLPPQIVTSHNSYWLWGIKDTNIKVIIAVDAGLEDLHRDFADVRPAGVFTCTECMEYFNNLGIFYCRKPRFSYKYLWAKSKFYI